MRFDENVPTYWYRYIEERIRIKHCLPMRFDGQCVDKRGIFKTGLKRYNSGGYSKAS